MARMVGKQWDINICCERCNWPMLGKSPNRKVKTKYKRHLKRREKQQVEWEIKEEKEK